jgi:hypothetical protein
MSEVTVKPGGKCTRCGRGLKRTYVVDGVPYGPVCVRKVFGAGLTITRDDGKVSYGTADKPKRKAKVERLEDTSQLSFFEPNHSPEVTYIGTILGNDDNRIVTAHRPGQPARSLPLNLEHVNHSPTGFCWGYGGSGPAQLAFSIMLDYLNGDVHRTWEIYQDFKSKFVVGWPIDKPFKITGQEIESFITAHDVEVLRREL